MRHHGPDYRDRSLRSGLLLGRVCKLLFKLFIGNICFVCFLDELLELCFWLLSGLHGIHFMHGMSCGFLLCDNRSHSDNG